MRWKKKSKRKKSKKKKEEERKKKKKNLFSVVLDKICVFCLYPILDSQQYIKRGSCRRPILFGLLCLFSFWASGLFVTSFEFGPRTLSLFILFGYFESFSISYLFRVYFVSNRYLSCCAISYRVMFFVFIYVKCLFIYLIVS